MYQLFHVPVNGSPVLLSRHRTLLGVHKAEAKFQKHARLIHGFSQPVEVRDAKTQKPLSWIDDVEMDLAVIMYETAKRLG